MKFISTTLTLACAIAACSKQPEAPAQGPVAAQIQINQNEREAIAADQFKRCSIARDTAGHAGSEQEGVMLMNLAISACGDFVSGADPGPKRDQATAMQGEARYWLREYEVNTKVREIEALIRDKEFDHARRALRDIKDDISADSTKRVAAAITAGEDAENAGWLPWTLDVEGFKVGESKCGVTQLARDFAGARAWAKEGWIEVRSLRETDEMVTIDHYDGLLKRNAVRTFYKDMATCKRLRGE